MNIHTPPRTAIDRATLRNAYRQDEQACVEQRLREGAPASAVHPEAAKLAGRLIEGARARKASGLDAFLQSYGLATEEGVALMCLAEALLRVPDNATADALIRDKLGGVEWSEHLGDSPSTFVNAATFSLMLTGEVLDRPELQQRGMGATLKRAVGRLGEPVIRAATLQAMRILGGQFVFGRTIEEALKRAKPERARGLTHSFDMLGEAAMTFADAERYRLAYSGAITRLSREAERGMVHSPGISVKLSALYPKYDFLHADQAAAALVPILKALAMQARQADIHFTIDAEEAERLELSMDIIEALVSDDDLFAGGWDGFGLAVQAYQKRALPLCDWAIRLARHHGRRLMVRLVKGAYWDSEIKISHVGGYADFPVFTRKISTDVSYLACAAKLLAAGDAIYSAFATHNAYTVGAIKALAQESGGQSAFEFQRLHGMGEDVYEELAKLEGNTRTPVRIYAPVGGHKELLAYLVRRLLENGANSSFVNRMADADVPVAELTTDPVTDLAAIQPKRNPAIPLPGDLFPGRINSAGIDLSDPLVREPLMTRVAALESRRWHAQPTFVSDAEGEVAPITMPHDLSVEIGTRRDALAEEVADAITRAEAIQPGWNALGGEKRAILLEAAADLFEEHTDEFLSLCQREAGKTLPDGVLELREAVDFLRYYAAEARRLFAAPTILPGPTGEENRLSLAGRGVFATISPWNFPLAIFIGQISAALVTGNTVVAKPAEQTSLLAVRCIELMFEAGLPGNALALLPGDGAQVGSVITADPRITGVAFTGSTQTAHLINRALAARDSAIAPMVAETGGQNAMLVDSTALPEQVVKDVVQSAFTSAGQRCSALRVLYIQEDIAPRVMELLTGAMAELHVCDPFSRATDLGPVIDADARNALLKHIETLKAADRLIAETPLPEGLDGHFVAPVAFRLESIKQLDREHFGPVLHVITWRNDSLDKVIDEINATGFGLTLGIHSRNEDTALHIDRRVRIGNVYINRNQIGAVVGVQPFGGMGLSGTGPKAGGPHYLLRFVTERTRTINTTAVGGNASLLSLGNGEP